MSDRYPALRARMDTFTLQYIETALWSSTDDDGEPLDARFRAEDIHPDTLVKMMADCEKFQADCNVVLESLSNDDVSRAGHDFWLTRNGHGAGFWDGDWNQPYPEAQADGESDEAYARRAALGTFDTVGEYFDDEIATNYGEFDLYVGDDGMVHGSNE